MGAKEIRAGKGNVELGVKDKTKAGLDGIAARFKRFGGQLQSIGAGITGIGAALVTPLVAASKLFASVGDQIDKTSARTGFSAEAISQLGFAAEQSGADVETLEKGLFGLSRSVYDAQRGSKLAADAFGKIGLSVADLQAMSPDEQFEAVAEGLSKIEDASIRGAVAQQLLGRAGRQLLPMFANGAAGVRDLREQADALGLTVSQEKAARAAALTDRMNELWRTIKDVGFEIGAAVAPALISLMKIVTPIIKRIADWVEENEQLFAWLLAIGGVLLTVGTGITAVGTVISVVGGAITAIGGAITFVVGVVGTIFSVLVAAAPAIAIIAGITAAVVALGAAGLQALGLLDTFISESLALFTDLYNTAVQTFGGIADALMAGEITLAAQIAWQGLVVSFYRALVSIEDAWQATTRAMGTLWTEFVAGLRIVWNDLSAWLAKAFLAALQTINEIAMAVTGYDLLGFDPEEAMRGVDEETSRRNNQVFADVAKARSDAQKTQGDTWLERHLRQSSGELDKLTDQAEKKRAAGEKEARKVEQSGPQADDEFDPEAFDVDAAMDTAAAAKTEGSRGAFSAAGASALLASVGGTSPELEEARRTRAAMEEVARLAREGRLVFT